MGKWRWGIEGLKSVGNGGRREIEPGGVSRYEDPL